jgi:hypothetical protein
MPFLTDDYNEEIIHEKLFWYSDYNYAIRKGDWKLIVNELDSTMELYHLDFFNKIEKNEVSKEHPEIAASLNVDLLQWVLALPSMLWPRLVDYQLYVNGKLTRWGV